MISKLNNKKIEITKRELKENEKHCDKCGGTGWLYIETEKEKYIERCPVCSNGIIHICPNCGEETGRTTYCNSPKCRNERELKRELELIEKATMYTEKNAPKESIKYFYSELYGYENGFFEDIDSFIDYCNDEEIEKPTHVWGTKEKRLNFDAFDIVSSELEDWYEDAEDSISDSELKKLQNFLDDFAKNCGVGSCYETDYKICIDISNL